MEEQREIKNRRELEETPTKEIDHHRRMSEQYPATTLPIIHHLDCDSMTDNGDQILLGTSQKIPELEVNKNNFLQKPASITDYITDKAKPTSSEKYITEVKCLQETTFSPPSDVTPEMVKTETMDPNLKK